MSKKEYYFRKGRINYWLREATFTEFLRVKFNNLLKRLVGKV